MGNYLTDFWQGMICESHVGNTGFNELGLNKGFPQRGNPKRRIQDGHQEFPWGIPLNFKGQSCEPKTDVITYSKRPMTCLFNKNDLWNQLSAFADGTISLLVRSNMVDLYKAKRKPLDQNRCFKNTFKVANKIL